MSQLVRRWARRIAAGRGATTPPLLGGAPAPPRAGPLPHGMQRAAALVGLLYLVVIVIGWVLIAPAAHDGIERTHETMAQETDEGVVIAAVAPGTPADQAGLRPGDVLLAVDGVPATGEALHDVLHRQRAGDRSTVRVRRASAGAETAEDVSYTLLSRLDIPSVVTSMAVPSLVGLLVVAVTVAVAVVRPREPAAALLLVFATSFSLGVVQDTWHWAMPTGQLADALDATMILTLPLGSAALLHLFLAFPTPQPLLRRLQGVGPPAFRPRGVWLLYIVLVAPPAVVSLTGWAPWGVAMLATLVGLLGALAALGRSYVRAPTALARAQLKWILWALATGVGAVVLALLAPPATGGRLQTSVPAAATAAWILFPISIAVAILRYRLWDIDLVINRTLLYSALSLGVAALYILAVGSLGLLFQSSGSITTSLLATGLVAVLFQPLRERLQRVVNRLLYGERDDPYTVLSRLGQRLEASLAPDTVLPTIVQTVVEALKLPYAAIALRQDETYVVVAAAGAPREPLLRLPLVYQHEPVGQLLLAARAPGEPMRAADHRLLEDLARQAGVAVHTVRLTTELQHARERLVSAREEERRRVRRDLHDGLGPTLAAHTLKVGAARRLLARDPAAADAQLAELEADLAGALADIRRLVYNLRPPALDELGLVGAIFECAAPYRPWRGTPAGEDGDGGLRVVVEAPERLPPLPAAVEVAAYRIVQEALSNVVRHARARTCVIRLAVGDALHVEVTDDGVGLPAVRGVGVGLTSMRERAAELGGSCLVAALPTGGTRVVARLPLPPAEAALPASASAVPGDQGICARSGV